MIGQEFHQWQLDFIHQQAGKITCEEMSRHVGSSPSAVYAYCRSKGLRMTRVYDVKPRPEFPIIKRAKVEEKKVFVRPKAVYDNKSSEQRISELLGENNY